VEGKQKYEIFNVWLRGSVENPFASCSGFCEKQSLHVGNSTSKSEQLTLIRVSLKTKTRVEKGLKYRVMNIKISNIDVMQMFKQ
jgi:hypothetical protein